MSQASKISKISEAAKEPAGFLYSIVSTLADMSQWFVKRDTSKYTTVEKAISKLNGAKAACERIEKTVKTDKKMAAMVKESMALVGRLTDEMSELIEEFQKLEKEINEASKEEPIPFDIGFGVDPDEIKDLRQAARVSQLMDKGSELIKKTNQLDGAVTDLRRIAGD